MISDPLKDYPGYALRRASNASLALLTPRLMEHDLRVSEATVILAIFTNPKIKQSELCKLLDIASANIAPLIGRLDKRQLITRIKVDGRSQGLELSEMGKSLATQILTIIEDHERALLEKMPEPLRAPFMEAIKYLWKPDGALKGGQDETP